ncbi:SusC/RagA family TonB-linked outer membrane protein (plasmid) [Fulvitalea axinellae]|uniref:SusC/RagA family TonB-linked outer membrane protein n=2 Tax=Fulvitalea axinellae TaxID=1182444 RepID=A0AAU9D860_9BACT|nr:SusC/RagA family TonB-linked outer membrane protein [Fulvitalea axinellae]
MCQKSNKTINTPLRSVFDSISDRYGVSISYNEALVSEISVNWNVVESSRTVEEALEIVLENTGLRHVMLSSKHVVIKREIKKIPEIITGKVRDEKGKTIPGVYVMIQESGNGTITGIDGNFTLALKPGDSILRFSAMGYISKKYLIGNSSNIDVDLSPKVTELSEVVVTALGISRQEKSLGYSVTQLGGNFINENEVVHVLNGLTGKVAGVNVRNTSPDPGSSVLVTIRGQSSLTGNNQPLFVIDGIPIVSNHRNISQFPSTSVDFGNPIIDINPDDIESLSVLKGASATALYGSRAGNGVIQIMTKNGQQAKDGLGIVFSSTAMFDKPTLFPDFQNTFGAGDREGTFQTVSTSSWGPRLDDGSQRIQWNSPKNEFGEPLPMPWLSYPSRHKDFYRIGQTLSNHIALFGNMDGGDYRVSYTRIDNKGIAPNTDLGKNTISLNAGYALNDRISIRTNFNYVNSNSDNRPTSFKSGDNVTQTVFRTTPNINIKELRGYWVPGEEGKQQLSHFNDGVDNPYFLAYENTNAFRRHRLNGYVSVLFKLNTSFTLKVRSGLDYYDERREGRNAFSSSEYETGAFSVEEISFTEQNTDFLLTYDKGFANGLDFSASVGGNRMDRISKNRLRYTDRLVVPGIFNLENAVPEALQKRRFNTKKRVNSLYALGRIGYKDMINLDLSVRNDWSSTLPPDRNSYLYPSASMSLIFSDLLRIGKGPLSFGKLRVGWAAVGNDTEPYQLYNAYRYGAEWDGVKRASTDFTLKNQNLRNEKKETWEFGTDLRFWEDKIGLDITYYHSKSKNQIVSIPTTIASGYDRKIINAGEITNKGWEIALNAEPFTGKMNWQAGIAFTCNENKVVKLHPGISRFRINSTSGIYEEVVEGGVMGDLYDRRTWKKVETGPYKGEYELTSEGYPIRDNRWKNVGNYNPDYMVGIHNALTFKNLRLYFLFDWKIGGEFYAYTAKNLLSDGRTKVTEKGRDRATGGLAWVDSNGNSRNDGMIIPGYIKNDDGSYRRNEKIVDPEDYYGSIYWDFEEFSTFSASYLKLRETTLTYTFGKFKKLPFRNISLSFIGRDLWAWYGYDDDNDNEDFIFKDYDQGYDPETQVSADGNFRQGVGAWALPATRSYGVKLSFEL